MLKRFRIFLLIGFFDLVILFTASCASRAVYVRNEPPTTRIEVQSAAPFPHAVWVAGNWHWSGKEYIWIAGKWTKPKRGKVWTAGHWQSTPRGWHWVSGRWQ